MATLAEQFNGKLAVYSTPYDIGVSNFYKRNANLHKAVVTQSVRKFWQCANAGKSVYLVFSGEEKSFNSMMQNFEGGRGSRSKKIVHDFQFLG